MPPGDANLYLHRHLAALINGENHTREGIGRELEAGGGEHLQAHSSSRTEGSSMKVKQEGEHSNMNVRQEGEH